MPSASKRDENSAVRPCPSDDRRCRRRRRRRVPPSRGCGSACRRPSATRRRSITDQHPVGPRVGADAGQHLLDQAHLAVRVDAHQAVREQQRQFFDDSLPFGQHERRGDDDAALRRSARECMPPRRPRCSSAPRCPETGEKVCPMRANRQFEVVVDLGCRAHGRTGVARIDLLFDGDGRRDARDDVHVGFVDLARGTAGRRPRGSRRSGAAPRRRSCRRPASICPNPKGPSRRRVCRAEFRPRCS